MKLEKGDVFKIKTKLGYGFIQYYETDHLEIEQIRVLEIISKNEEVNQELINTKERWCTGFPVKAAARKKIITKVGTFKIPKKFKNYKFAREEHYIRNEFKGWFIINKETLKRKLIKKLKKRHLKFSPHGIMNDTIIIEMLEENWKLENWNKKK